MRTVFGIIGVAAFAIATSVGFAQLQAATDPLLDYCPATPASDAGTCVVAANMFLAVGKPGDDKLVASINAIAGQVQAGPTRGAACADAAAGIKVLAAAVGNAPTKAMAEALAAALCGGGGAGGTATLAIVSTNSLSTPVTAGGPPPPAGCTAPPPSPGSSSGGGCD